MNVSESKRKYNERLTMRQSEKERIRTAVIKEFKKRRAAENKNFTNAAIIRELALKYGCSYSFISNALSQAGIIEIRSRCELLKISEQRKASVIARYQELRAQNEDESDFALIRIIAAEFECGFNSVYRTIRTYKAQ